MFDSDWVCLLTHNKVSSLGSPATPIVNVDQQGFSSDHPNWRNRAAEDVPIDIRMRSNQVTCHNGGASCGFEIFGGLPVTRAATGIG